MSVYFEEGQIIKYIGDETCAFYKYGTLFKVKPQRHWSPGLVVVEPLIKTPFWSNYADSEKPWRFSIKDFEPFR